MQRFFIFIGICAISGAIFGEFSDVLVGKITAGVFMAGAGYYLGRTEKK